MNVAEGITSVFHDYKLNSADLSFDACWLAMDATEKHG
jgi:hypothetical protein